MHFRPTNKVTEVDVHVIKNNYYNQHVLRMRDRLHTQVSKLEEVGTDHVSDHALRFSSDVKYVSMERMSFVLQKLRDFAPGSWLE